MTRPLGEVLPDSTDSTDSPGALGSGSGSVLVSRLSLVTFRSYSALEVEFPAGPQVVVGDNAAGKTNLVESMVVLGTGHSHRASLDGELIAWGADFTRLEADVGAASGDARLERLELVIARTTAGGGRKKA